MLFCFIFKKLLSLSNDFGIDILCVACYYSDRYTNADNYIINNCDDDNIQTKILQEKEQNDDYLSLIPRGITLNLWRKFWPILSIVISKTQNVRTHH